MLKQNLKQAWVLLRANPLVSIVSIAGTALSIATIMVIVFFFQVRLGNFAPENSRDKMLYVNIIRAESEGSTNNSALSYEVLKEIFYPLETPVAVTGMCTQTSSLALPEKKIYKEYDIKITDTGFWEVFDFTFLSGQPFSAVDFESGLQKAVVTESTARELYATTDVIGKVFIHDFMEYTICGVIKDVSKATSHAYAEVFIPSTTTAAVQPGGGRFEGVPGPFQVAIRAKDKKDFDAVRNEIMQKVAVYSSSKNETDVSIHGVLSHIDAGLWGNPLKASSSKELFVRGIILILFLLLIPALNLTGVTQASIQQRRSELGLRKSFGATYMVLVKQIINENLVISFIGGFVGLLFSILLLEMCKSFLFTNDPTIHLSMILKPGVFIVAVLFTLLLNLLSSLIPAVRIAGQPIVDAIKDQE